MQSKEVKLSPVLLRTYRAIESFFNENGYAPTVGELAEILSKNQASVHENLNSLINKGYLRRTVGRARSLEIVRAVQTTVIDLVAIPLVGNVPAGVPFTFDEHADSTVCVEKAIVGRDSCFALRVTGESMKDADILEGDMLVVRQQPIAASGDIVVASVDGGITVKRLWIGDRSIELRPENRAFHSIEINNNSDFRILGKVVATRRVVAQL